MELSALEKATEADQEEIVTLFRRAVEHLNETGIPQWDEIYPTANDVAGDIQNGQLYVARLGMKIAGVITLNQTFDPEYANGDWNYQGPDYMVVHRLCVSPDAQGQGVGTRMMRMAEAMLKEQGVQSMRLDTFSRNPWSMRIYQKLDYRTVGKAVWRKGLFYLMEKNIGGETPR